MRKSVRAARTLGFGYVGGDLPFDADDKDELGLLFDVEGALLFAQTVETNLLALCIAILFDVGLCALEYDAALFLIGLLSSEVLALTNVMDRLKEAVFAMNDSDPKDGINERQH